MGSVNSKQKRRKCDRYRPLSPLISDTESGSVVSSVHVMSSAVVAKRLSQAEPPLPVPSRTPPCSPPPQPDLTTTTTQPANDTIVDSDPENVHPAVLHRHRIDSCGGTVASPHARPHSTGNPLPRPLSPANSAPFAPSKQQKWSSAHAHRYSQHHYCPPSSESSSSRQHHHHHQQQQQQQQEQELSPAMEQHAKRNAPYQQPFPGYPLSQATTMAAASARAHHRRRSNLSMAPTDEQHRWTWNLQPDTADNRVSERDFSAMLRRMNAVVRGELAHPIGDNEEYQIEVKLTKVRKNSHPPARLAVQTRREPSEADVIYSVPTRRCLIAREMQDSVGHSNNRQHQQPAPGYTSYYAAATPPPWLLYPGSSNHPSKPPRAHSHKPPATDRRELVRIIAQNHERNNVSIHPSRVVPVRRERTNRHFEGSKAQRDRCLRDEANRALLMKLEALAAHDEMDSLLDDRRSDCPVNATASLCATGPTTAAKSTFI